MYGSFQGYFTVTVKMSRESTWHREGWDSSQGSLIKLDNWYQPTLEVNKENEEVFKLDTLFVNLGYYQ